MLVPAGFPAGEAQFEGAGVRVVGMESGKASACFTLATIASNRVGGAKLAFGMVPNGYCLSTTITSTRETVLPQV